METEFFVGSSTDRARKHFVFSGLRFGRLTVSFNVNLIPLVDKALTKAQLSNS
jgi:hypothetical protein